MKSDTEEYLIKYNKYVLIIIGIILIGITIYAVGAQEMVTAQITKSQTGLVNGSWINLSSEVNATEGTLFFEIKPETWTKKRALHINNTDREERTYILIYITIPYISGMNEDFSDITFRNDTDSTVQPHYIKSKVNGSYANVWINISHLNADTWINDTYYMYYSNPSATYDNEEGLNNTLGTYTESWQEGGAVENQGDVLNSGITNDGGSSNTNYVSWPAMLRGLGNDAVGSTTRYMIKFNLTKVTSGSIVNNATLTLTYVSYYYGTWEARLHRTITSYIDETVPTWNNFNGQSNWDSLISSSTPSPGSGNPLIFSGANFATLVTQLVNGTYTNNGFYLKTNELGGDREAKYYSSNAVNPADRPKLTLTWTGPAYPWHPTETVLSDEEIEFFF